MKWISVNDKLPKYNQRVLCFQPANDYLPDWVYEGYLEHSKRFGKEWFAVEDPSIKWYPTHWMNLPTKPERDHE